MTDKANILDAIRRCANANSGVAVGRQRFAAMTGIYESQWLGRYWTRWSDAVREAGFEPNSLQEKTPDDALLDKLVEFIREVGHFPTQPEVRLRRRTDPSFPSHNVFRRFGRKAGVAAKLVEYCAGDPALEDVVAICEPVAAVAPNGREVAEGDSSLVVGSVYLMKSGSHFKIGRSNSVGRRAYELAIQLPEKLELVHVIETDDPVGIERYWHERFADRRANGEWFALTKADVSAFRRRRTLM